LCTTFTVVDELVRVSPSSQITTVPSTTLVAGLINNLDIRGPSLLGGEILEKVNETLLTVIVCTGNICSTELRGCSKFISCNGGIKVIVHSRALPDMVHVNSSSSPLHAGATSVLIPGEFIVTMPAYKRY
jgi:hypothetical protein